jgi:transaldolase
MTSRRLLGLFLLTNVGCFLTTLAFTPTHRGPSRFFLDTADTEEWEALMPTGIFHGVTTNPTLLQRAGEACTIGNIHRLAAEALTLGDEFMCQAWGDDLYACGMQLTAPARDRITVKVPVTGAGVEAASRLIQSGCRVCLTACYNHRQALLAASVGAEYLAPYLGRMSDAGKDGTSECLSMNEIVKGMGSSTRILVASIRDAQTLADLAAGGMDTFTFSPAVARELFVEALTDEAAAVFEADAASEI